MVTCLILENLKHKMVPKNCVLGYRINTKYLLHLSNVDQAMNRAEARNKKLAWPMFVLCLCYAICSLPHIIYGYTAHSYKKHADHIYMFTLGLLWCQYGFNVCVYMAQRDQYWNAYKDYMQEKVLPMISCKSSCKEDNIEVAGSRRSSRLSSGRRSNKVSRISNKSQNRMSNAKNTSAPRKENIELLENVCKD